MVKEERFEYILNYLKHSEKISYELMAVAMNVSEDTVRRDIELLHQNGLLTKVRGGAILRSKNPLSFQDRSDYLSGGKEIIALKAQPFIKKNQTVFMDGGTTICTIAAHLPIDASFRVVTNNVALIPILSTFKHIEIILVGGIYDRITEITYGLQACEEISNYVADFYFMGTCAISHQFGITAAFREDCAIKKAMMANAARTIAISNIEKLDTTEAFKVCDMEDIDTLITDMASDDARLNPYRNMGFAIV